MPKLVLSAVAAAGAAFLLWTAATPTNAAEPFAPYGSATTRSQDYAPLKYVIESSAFDPAEVANTLRIAAQMLPLSPMGSEMTIVIIGGGIRVFAKENYEKYMPIVEAAADLRNKGVKLLYCGSSMRGAGFAAEDLHGLGAVVPGGYVEIAALISKGFSPIRPAPALRQTPGARYVDQPGLKKN